MRTLRAPRSRGRGLGARGWEGLETSAVDDGRLLRGRVPGRRRQLPGRQRRGDRRSPAPSRRSLRSECERRYWEIFEELRTRLGYADYLGALQQYRLERPREPRVLEIALYLLHYRFADRVYPGALDAVARLAAHGPVVILSDGDVVFQPRKVERSGLWDAVEGRVLIYIHKEEMLDDVELRYPARRYVMVDDKVRILAAMKAIWGDRLT